MIERVLYTDGADLSATATLRRRQDEATSFGRLLPIRDTLTAAVENGDADCAPATDEIKRLIAMRAARAREQLPCPHARRLLPPCSTRAEPRRDTSMTSPEFTDSPPELFPTFPLCWATLTEGLAAELDDDADDLAGLLLGRD